MNLTVHPKEKFKKLLYPNTLSSTTPSSVEVFMWGRSTREWQLTVNGRKYDWGDHGNTTSAHVERCIEFEKIWYDGRPT